MDVHELNMSIEYLGNWLEDITKAINRLAAIMALPYLAKHENEQIDVQAFIRDVIKRGTEASK
jgi:hypothetical protein